jgi:GNAT superfamily N-acetyltransferase
VTHLRELTEADLPQVQALVERCRAYYVQTTGSGPEPTAARGIWDALPPETPRSAKLTLGLFEPGLVGLLDVVRGWPGPRTWLIGLLLLDPAIRRRGAGSAAVAEVGARAAQEGADTLRVGVVPENPGGLAFWAALGFRPVAPVNDSPAAPLERAVAG